LYQYSFFPEEDISAFVMSDGSILGSNIIEKAKKSYDSNALDIENDIFGEAYASGLVYKPPYSFKNLKMFSVENPYHFSAMEKIAQDAFSDFKICSTERKNIGKPEPLKKLSRTDKQLYDFFENCNDDFLQLCRDFALDFQTFSFATMELVRTKNGTPTKLNHVQAETCRIAKRMSNEIYTDSRYIIQVVDTHERIFKVFDEEGPPKMREPHTNNIMTEMLYLTKYDPNGGKYGVPRWLPALKALVGMDKVAQYNINFFNNEAVPRFAVVIQGGKLDDETKNVIKNYFKNDLKGVSNAHKTLVLSTPKGAEVKLIPLAVEMKDGSFKLYRKDCRDEILSAHGVPPHRMNVLDAGSSGSLSPGTVIALDKVYKYSVIEPLQKRVEALLNKVIKYGFGINNRVIKFNDLDIGEDKEKAETVKIIAAAHEKYYATGILTVDEIRKELNYEPYSEIIEDENTKEWSTTPRPIYLIKQANLQAQNQQMLGVSVAGQSANETANEFNDSSKEQTNNTLSDKGLESLMITDNNGGDANND